MIARLRAKLDPVYLRNRIMYVLAEHPPLSDDFNDPNSNVDTTEPHIVKRKFWSFEEGEESNNKNVLVSKDVKGLVVNPNFFDEEEVNALVHAMNEIGNEITGWFEYHPGRDMYAMQPYPHVDQKMIPILSTLESQNRTKPTDWPKLSDFKALTPVLRLQQFLESGEFTAFAKSQPCLFVQVQRVERGIPVGSHKDDLRKGGRVICTAVLKGENRVRVGDVEFRVRPGDIYALSDQARFDVDHEVLPETSDRLSLTLRFGVVSDDEIKKREEGT
jgi:hypothetical protein